MISIPRILFVFFLLAASGVPAAAESGRTPVPAPAKAAKGEQCVEPVADMRRNHMQYLEHERDETMHKGIRGRKHSLKTCVECHAVPTPAAGGAKTIEPFCGECHQYAAVSLDCFQCHTGSPGGGTAAIPAGGPKR
ncbi:MAG: hypothetical protein FJX42_00495 [Alphaproteobacteria bacterium]|nr:hypothetical protein [Alphaproteobacteria bacterium]